MRRRKIIFTNSNGSRNPFRYIEYPPGAQIINYKWLYRLCICFDLIRCHPAHRSMRPFLPFGIRRKFGDNFLVHLRTKPFIICWIWLYKYIYLQMEKNDKNENDVAASGRREDGDEGNSTYSYYIKKNMLEETRDFVLAIHCCWKCGYKSFSNISDGMARQNNTRRGPIFFSLLHFFFFCA